MEHTEYVCKGGHDYPSCQFCDGGLFACTICGGAEGSLPTNCPGVKMTDEQSNAIYAGTLDYREGRGWVVPDGTGKSMGDLDIFTASNCHAVNESAGQKGELFMACAVCAPYGKPGYQELCDGSVDPCYGCNRKEFEAEALHPSPRYEDENGKTWRYNHYTKQWDIPID